MRKGSSGSAQARREVCVPETAIYAALTAMAAAIEEPYCVLGKDELHGLIAAHGRLCRAIGLDQLDYCYRDGSAFVAARARGGGPDARAGQLWIKTGLVTENPYAVEDGEGQSEAQAHTSNASSRKREGQSARSDASQRPNAFGIGRSSGMRSDEPTVQRDPAAAVSQAKGRSMSDEALDELNDAAESLRAQRLVEHDLLTCSQRSHGGALDESGAA